MPRPNRGTITSKTSTNALIRASKSEFIRSVYARLGPKEFYRRRLERLQANGKATSYGLPITTEQKTTSFPLTGALESATKLLKDGMPPRDVAESLGVSVPTLYRWVPAASR